MTKWIKVCEELPEKKKDVLLSCDDGMICVGYLACDGWRHKINNFGSYREVYPKYWMYLPDRPMTMEWEN